VPGQSRTLELDCFQFFIYKTRVKWIEMWWVSIRSRESIRFDSSRESIRIMNRPPLPPPTSTPLASHWKPVRVFELLLAVSPLHSSPLMNRSMGQTTCWWAVEQVTYISITINQSNVFINASDSFTAFSRYRISLIYIHIYIFKVAYKWNSYFTVNRYS